MNEVQCDDFNLLFHILHQNDHQLAILYARLDPVAWVEINDELLALILNGIGEKADAKNLENYDRWVDDGKNVNFDFKIVL